LKWNDFHSNTSNSFGLFRYEEYLHDVTLVTGDQKLVTAHKLVLSTSSEYFKNIFKNSKISNPFLCLDGISSTDLNNILDYIYNGEVQIYQEHLDRFLAVAQRFKLEGLLGGEKEELEENHIPSYDPPPSRNNKPVKVEPELPESLLIDTSIQLNNQNQPMDANDPNDIDNKLYEYMSRNSDGKYSCKVCGKIIQYKSHAKSHVETHMDGLTFPCHTCGKEFRTRTASRLHVYRNHKQ